MSNREIDALCATRIMGWKSPAMQMESAGDRGWGQQERGGKWVLRRWFGEYDSSIDGGYQSELLDSATEQQFCQRYYWQSPDGEFIAPTSSFSDPPISPSTDPAASKQLQDKLNELKWYWRIERAPSGAVTVSIWGNFGTVVTMRGTVVETAFALAALKAVGVLEEEK